MEAWRLTIVAKRTRDGWGPAVTQLEDASTACNTWNAKTPEISWLNLLTVNTPQKQLSKAPYSSKHSKLF